MSNGKKVCIIYTGGTIGMVSTENGYAPEKGVLAKELAAIRDLSSDSMPAWDLIEFDPLLDSSNVTHREWNKIADIITGSYGSYDGFIVLHGTDTMAYSASALSFMLEGLDKPVVFTGSQIPLCELRSDGRDNLIASMMIASEGVVKEVSLFFSNVLLRGNRSIKLSSDGLIAFQSPNLEPLATVGIDINYNYSLLLGSNISRAPGTPLSVSHIKDLSIGVIKLFPGINFNMFAPVASEGTDGLILETFGAGNIPSNDNTLPEVIKTALEHGTAIVVCTQCPKGSARLGTYETGAALKRAGVISGSDMTTEAAVTKLMWLLSRDISGDELRAAMESDIRGELSYTMAR